MNRKQWEPHGNPEPHILTSWIGKAASYTPFAINVLMPGRERTETYCVYQGIVTPFKSSLNLLCTFYTDHVSSGRRRDIIPFIWLETWVGVEFFSSKNRLSQKVSFKLENQTAGEAIVESLALTNNCVHIYTYTQLRSGFTPNGSKMWHGVKW